ncbi:hypothetical protein BUALT_Bualt01G0215000 [Buddleja alternifolia]|uniref:Cytochrome P450 n=1 Tax=Buddleja alternifolia TaxID=168488 RepID=A0AAV6YJG0_9LAMI|nr:hypothetical protein BUALT_Bualt01G0215000 [Buddleja alternifolia]
MLPLILLSADANTTAATPYSSLSTAGSHSLKTLPACTFPLRQGLTGRAKENWTQERARKSSKLPPGPFQFPIIGNIFLLGSKPHLSLANLSRKYGSVMSLKLGSITTIVISSPEAAKSVLQTHDLVFSSRTIPSAAKCCNHDEFSMGWLPVENQWRKLRKICKEQMFSVSRLDASQGLRREKQQKLCDYVNECCETGRAVDIGEAAFTTSLNLMSATLFSKEFAQFNTEMSQEMKQVVWGVSKCVGTPNYADYFPVLKSFDPRGILNETKIYFERLFVIFDEIIDEKLKNRSRGGQKNDLVDALIEINQRDEAELSRTDIKHLLLGLEGPSRSCGSCGYRDSIPMRVHAGIAIPVPSLCGSDSARTYPELPRCHPLL